LVARPNTLFNIAQCNEELGRYDRAVKAYEEFLRRAAPDDTKRAAAAATMSSLKKLLGTIVIETNLPGEVWLSDRKVGATPGSILVPGGRHSIEVRRDGFIPVRREVEVAGRQSVTLSIELKEARKEITVNRIEKSGLPRYVFWSGVAATSVAAAAGLGFGAHAWFTHRSASDKDPRFPREDDADTVSRSKNIADIFFVSAGVFAVGTTVVYFMTDWDSEKTQVAPLLGDDTVGVMLRGTL